MPRTVCRLDAVIAFGVALFTLAAPAAAQSAKWPSLAEPPNVEPDGAPDAAVVVGIEDYLFIPKVPGAARNARDWYVFLTECCAIKAR